MVSQQKILSSGQNVHGGVPLLRSWECSVQSCFLMRQHYEFSDYGQSERGSSKDRLHRFPSILAAPRASPARSMVSDGLAPPNPASPARSDFPLAAKPQSPGREPGGPSSLLQSQSLSFFGA
ncbi:hypothetical protein AVEN_65260-1 [Araneus ventricosus]|uniref:Uncharacterized protein n=1 Tax=Araneus ventricosus TaxID=182803 RepID=A0A4Y2AHJ8_ARAVE|nr:hypothetical protein AVEN_65260-1 [Araneus ventricosus]